LLEYIKNYVNEWVDIASPKTIPKY
jgi:hypothetical protein